MTTKSDSQPATAQKSDNSQQLSLSDDSPAMDVAPIGSSSSSTSRGAGASTGSQSPQNASTSNDSSSADETAQALTAGEPSVSLARLHELVKSHQEWVKHIIFDGDGNVLLSNIKPPDGEVAYVARDQMCLLCAV